jgi:hypothetical protein
MKLLASILLGCVATSLTAAGAKQVFSTPIVPSDPDAAGKELVARLLSLRPVESITNGATLTNLVKKRFQFAVPLRIEVSVTESNWTTSYAQQRTTNHDETRFVVVRSLNSANEYYVETATNGVISRQTFHGQDAVVPIAGSDFTLADMGMEFLRWPSQRLLKKEVCRTQACDKLESLAPDGWTNGYVRVISWFDIDTGGPVLVEAYDAKEMVKEFKPNDFTKVNGQWRVEELEMRDLRTGSRSFIRFNLKD